MSDDLLKTTSQRVLGNLVNTPKKPYKPTTEKREPGEPNSRPASDKE